MTVRNGGKCNLTLEKTRTYKPNFHRKASINKLWVRIRLDCITGMRNQFGTGSDVANHLVSLIYGVVVLATSSLKEC